MTNAQPTSRYLERDGVKLHYLDWGGEGRPAVVLVHGSRLHAHVWNDFARRFADRYHIVAVDQRGHGDSAWAAESAYRLEDFYGDLRAIVQSRGLTRYNVIGHSLGGRVSMLYTHRHADEVERLVLVDITPGRIAANADERTDLPARPGPRDFESVEQGVEHIGRLMSFAPPHMIEESVRMGLRRKPDGRYTWKYDPAIARRRRSVDDPDLWPLVKETPTPTLLQYGSDSDVVNSELAERMAQTMPRCAVERIERAGHGLFTDQPDAFAQSVERFLSKR